jgi:hypothetical protein
LGVWIAIVKIAAGGEPRGTLPRAIESIARMSGLQLKVIEEAVPRLIEMGWVEEMGGGTGAGAFCARPR